MKIQAYSISKVFSDPVVWGLLRHPSKLNIDIYCRYGFNLSAQSASATTII